MKLKCILMTGAAGSVGTALRPYLSQLADTVRLTDLKQIDDLSSHEEFTSAALDDVASLVAALEGCDAVIHLAGVPVEDSWAKVLPANIEGLYNLYEAVRASNGPRVIFASSNHTIGYYERGQRIDTEVPVRPDTLYGVSKCFGEALASLYHDKFGIETLSLRIGSFRAAPTDRRMLATWVSAGDTYRLIERALLTPRLGHTVVYGVSANNENWWDNSRAGFLGWTPRDNADDWRDEMIDAQPDQHPDDPAVRYQGGSFCAFGHPDDTSEGADT